MPEEMPKDAVLVREWGEAGTIVVGNTEKDEVIKIKGMDPVDVEEAV